MRVGLGARVISETPAGCSSPMPTPKDQSRPVPRKGHPAHLTEHTVGVRANQPVLLSPPPPFTWAIVSQVNSGWGQGRGLGTARSKSLLPNDEGVCVGRALCLGSGNRVRQRG